MALETEGAAFLLHSRPYRENQQILAFLTECQGKLAAVTYLGKLNKSDKRGLLQPFLPLKITLKGEGTLKTLVRVEASAKSYSLAHHSLYSGFYLNELLVRLLGEAIACPGLFERYQLSLQALSEQSEIEPVLRQFEMALLDELGLSIDFSPVFENEAGSFYYVPEQGFIPAEQSLALPCYDGKHIKAIARQQLSSQQVLRSFKMLIRQVLGPLLGNKPLNSRKLFTKQEF